MRRFLLASSFLACLPLSGAALAGDAHVPQIKAGVQPMSEAALGNVTGGLFDTYVIMPITVVNTTNTAVATGIDSGDITANALSQVDVDTLLSLQTGGDTLDIDAGEGTTLVIAPPSSPARPTNGLARGAMSPAAQTPTPSGGVAPVAAANGAAVTPVWIPWARELRPYFPTTGQ
ncbi:MAG: hypothetical protein ACFB3T_03845 [Geminicoccaceae bacterium]